MEKQEAIVDRIGGVPIIIAMEKDKRSVRAFERNIEGNELELFIKTNSSTFRLIDSQTNTEWDFTGKAVSGEMVGKQLKKVYVLKDYWFDWKLYNPKTKIYSLN